MSKCVFGLSDFTTRCARGTEATEAYYYFPLPGDDGKGKTTADSWQIGKRAKLAARRAETFVGPSSPGPAKNNFSVCSHRGVGLSEL